MPGGNFICHRCKKAFRDDHDLQRHLDNKKPCTPAAQQKEDTQWVCIPCKHTYASHSSYKAHLKSQIHERMVQESTSTSEPVNRISEGAGPHLTSNPQERICVVFDSVTGTQDLRQAQFYFGFAGPPEHWFDVKRSDGTPFVSRPDQLILKFGQHISDSTRNVTHIREYGIWQVLDSVLTDNPTRVERDAKDDLRNRNELLSAFHKNKRNRDTELIAVNATEYKAFLQKVMKMARRYNIDMERELTKRQEIEAEARKAESQARIAEATVRLLELQMKMKQMETSST